MTCPFCESSDVEIVSPWAGQIITCQMRCRTCNTYFEAIREEFAESGPEAESHREPNGPDSVEGIRLDAAGLTWP